MRGLARTKRWLAVTATLGALVVGGISCGSDDDSPGSGAPASSGLPGTKQVGTLSSSEMTQLCNSVSNSFKDPAVSDSLCKFLSVFGVTLEASLMPTATDAQLRTSCTMGYDECKKSGTTTGECKPAGASCTATVAEVEKCLADSKAALIALGANIPACSAITRASLNSSQGAPTAAPTDPASCTALEQKCPGIIPDPMSAD